MFTDGRTYGRMDGRTDDGRTEMSFRLSSHGQEEVIKHERDQYLSVL